MNLHEFFVCCFKVYQGLQLTREQGFTRTSDTQTLRGITASPAISEKNLSCQHEGKMRSLHIPKLTVCQMCMKPLSLLRS